MNSFYKATLAFLGVLFLFLALGIHYKIIENPAEFAKEQFTNIAFAVAVWVFVVVVNRKYGWEDKSQSAPAKKEIIE